MAAVEGSAMRPASGRQPATALAPELRWHRRFPGEERQISGLRRWLAGLLPECPSRDDVVTVAVELATNTLKFTASGRAAPSPWKSLGTAPPSGSASWTTVHRTVRTSSKIH